MQRLFIQFSIIFLKKGKAVLKLASFPHGKLSNIKNYVFVLQSAKVSTASQSRIIKHLFQMSKVSITTRLHRNNTTSGSCIPGKAEVRPLFIL